MKNIYTKKSEIDGTGVFVNRNFKKGEVVFIISGRIKKFTEHFGCNCEICKYAFGFQVGKWLDPPPNNLQGIS